MSSTRVLIIEFNDRRDTTMKAVVTGFLLAATLTLAGCGVAYQQQRSEILKSASAESFGPPPPADYRSIGEAFFKRLLKDPDSAKFEWVVGPRHEAIQPEFASPHAIPVWVTAVRINSKNSFGGYTGFDPFALAWKNGKIVAYTTENTGGGLGFWQNVQ